MRVVLLGRMPAAGAAMLREQLEAGVHIDVIHDLASTDQNLELIRWPAEQVGGAPSENVGCMTRACACL